MTRATNNRVKGNSIAARRTKEKSQERFSRLYLLREFAAFSFARHDEMDDSLTIDSLAIDGITLQLFCFIGRAFGCSVSEWMMNFDRKRLSLHQLSDLHEYLSCYRL